MPQRVLAWVGLCCVMAATACTSSEPVAVGEAPPWPGKVSMPPVSANPVPMAGTPPGTPTESGLPVPVNPATCPPQATLGPRGMTPFRATFTGLVSAEVPPPPLSGGTLHVLADGSAAVASDPDSDRVYVVDLKSNTLRASVALTAKDEPGRIIEDGDRRVHVALRRGGAVVTLNPITGVVVNRRAVCPAPRGIAYQAAGDLIHVACAGGELVSLPAAGGAPKRTLTLDRDLRDVVVVGTELLVSKFRAAEVLVVGPDGVVGSKMKLPSRPRKGLRGPEMMSASVAWRMQVAAGGTGAVVVHQRGVDGEISIGGPGGGYAGGGRCDGVVESTVSMVMPGQTPVQAPGIAMSVLPLDLAVSRDGQKIAVISAGNAQIVGAPPPVMVLAAGNIIRPPGPDCIPPGGVPAPVVMPPADPPIVTSKQPPGQAVAVAFAPDDAVVVQSREPAALWLGSTGQVITLSETSHADTGHQVFHANAGGGIACASCHPEGGEDGRVWTFSCIGARRTQSMRGGIIGTEPFHWDGDMTTFSTLVHEVFEGRMSGPPLTAGQTDATLRWIDSVPALPAPASLDAAAIARGRTLFHDKDVACASCHTGARFTNNTSADVGTGKAFQVPSLINISARAPFIHNGCAPTLKDRFGACGGGDKHGKTSHLSAAQINDLVSYLETL
jgi:mono/diheme cytochrome c family protein